MHARWWRVGISVAMIPVFGFLGLAFGNPFWVGALQGAVVGALFWLVYYLRAR